METGFFGERKFWRWSGEPHADGMKCGVSGTIFSMPHDLIGGLGCKCGLIEGHRAPKRFRGHKMLVLKVHHFYSQTHHSPIGPTRGHLSPSRRTPRAPHYTPHSPHARAHNTPHSSARTPHTSQHSPSHSPISPPPSPCSSAHGHGRGAPRLPSIKSPKVPPSITQRLGWPNHPAPHASRDHRHFYSHTDKFTRGEHEGVAQRSASLPRFTRPHLQSRSMARRTRICTTDRNAIPPTHDRRATIMDSNQRRRCKLLQVHSHAPSAQIGA